MNWYELVRKYFPRVSDETCEVILREKTAYPAASAAEVERQIAEFKAEVSR